MSARRLVYERCSSCKIRISECVCKYAKYAAMFKIPQYRLPHLAELGLDVSQDQIHLIKQAYRTLARKYHPDKNGEEERMKRINLAYKTLIGI